MYGYELDVDQVECVEGEDQCGDVVGDYFEGGLCVEGFWLCCLV